MKDRAHFYGNQVVIASWIAVFCLFGIRASFAVLKDPLADHMGWGHAQVTLGYSFMMICYALTAFLCGIIVDKYGAKPVYFIAALTASAGLLTTGFMKSYAVYIAAFSILNGIATGMLWVTSTITIRKWFVGKLYAVKWGWAFVGAPAAQFVLTYLVKYIIENNPDSGWRIAFIVLALISGFLLFIAVICAKKEPEYYGMNAFGQLPGDNMDDKLWSVKEAFSKYAIWAVIGSFLTSMMAEFLIWTQIVSFWVIDIGWSRSQSSNVYAFIGLVGIVSMPLMGYLADYLVRALNNEISARKIMLIIGPFLGFAACILLLQSRQSVLFAYSACILFAFYWAIVPGGVVGYTGAVYGRRTLGKIWGLSTLIVMGTGPFLGSFIGGYLKDHTGHFTYALYFAAGSFILSILLAYSLPKKISKR